jgi:ubiquinone/menaquinone biosynthesis C-methylase UbiE
MSESRPWQDRWLPRRRWRRRLFQALYYELAWAYDAVSWLVSLGAWDAWRCLALAYVDGERVLEIGSGTGALLAAAAQQGLNPIGLDRSSSMVRQTRRRLQRRGLPVQLVQGDWRALPFARASFATVIATFPAEVIVEAEAWQELARVLAPGGRFIGVIAARPTNPLLRALVWLLDRLVPTDEETVAKWRRLPALAEAAGLEVLVEQHHVHRAMVSVLIATRSARHDAVLHHPSPCA